MKRICIKSRDQLVVINLAKLACVVADGNYSKLLYIDKRFPSSLITIGISKLAEILQKGEENQARPVFLRLGRSLIVNQNYLLNISIPKQRILLTDWGENIHAIKVSKPLLKQYKEQYETLQQAESSEPTE